MWRIDLPESSVGSPCFLCEPDGISEAARFRDPNGADICDAHFIVMVRLTAMLRAAEPLCSEVCHG